MAGRKRRPEMLPHRRQPECGASNLRFLSILADSIGSWPLDRIDDQKFDRLSTWGQGQSELLSKRITERWRRWVGLDRSPCVRVKDELKGAIISMVQFNVKYPRERSSIEHGTAERP